MKGISGLLAGGRALALARRRCRWRAGSSSATWPQAQANVATLNYDGVRATFDKAERYYEYGSHLPWVGNGPVNDIRARKAALHYWQRVLRGDHAAADRSGRRRPGRQRRAAARRRQRRLPHRARRETEGQGDDDAGARCRDQRLSRRAQERDRARKTPRSTTSTSCGCATSWTRASASPDAGDIGDARARTAHRGAPPTLDRHDERLQDLHPARFAGAPGPGRRGQGRASKRKG